MPSRPRCRRIRHLVLSECRAGSVADQYLDQGKAGERDNVPSGSVKPHPRARLPADLSGRCRWHRGCPHRIDVIADAVAPGP